MPIFCYYCGRLGHGERNYVFKENDGIFHQHDQQYSHWLRAGSGNVTAKSFLVMEDRRSPKKVVGPRVGHARSQGLHKDDVDR